MTQFKRVKTFSNVDYHFCSPADERRDRVHMWRKGRDTLGMGLPFSVRCVTWPLHAEISIPTRDDEKKIDPTTARQSAPLLFLSYLFVAVSLSLFNVLQLSTNTYPSTNPSHPFLPYCYFHSVSFCSVSLIVSTLCLFLSLSLSFSL